jgi:hypothetical protein
MQSSKNILFSLIVLMLSASLAVAQVQSGQSRLNIGLNVKPSSVSTTPISSYIVRGNVPSEISVSNKAAINAFYKDLLLTKTKKVEVVAKSIFTPEHVSNDKLYEDRELSISNIYPNPANDFAVLDYSLKNSSKEAKVTFLNILGGTVGEYKLDSFDNNIRIRTDSWDNGIYFYQLMIEGKKVATKKLLVRHN